MKTISSPRLRRILTTGIATLLALESAKAATYTYNSTATNTSGTATQWDAGTFWNAIPVSASDTTLTFGGVSLAASATLFTNGILNGDVSHGWDAESRLAVGLYEATPGGPAVATHSSLRLIPGCGRSDHIVRTARKRALPLCICS